MGTCLENHPVIRTGLIDLELDGLATLICRSILKILNAHGFMLKVAPRTYAIVRMVSQLKARSAKTTVTSTVHHAMMATK